MNEVPKAIARWLEQKRRTDRALAAVISALTLGGGAVVFLLASLSLLAQLPLLLRKKRRLKERSEKRFQRNHRAQLYQNDSTALFTTEPRRARRQEIYSVLLGNHA